MHAIADGPQYRLHKGSKCGREAASGFNPSRGPGRGLHRIGQDREGRSKGQPDISRRIVHDDWTTRRRWPIVRNMRLKSSIWVAAYLRRCQTEGIFGAVRKRGAEEAGAVFVKVALLDGNAMLYAPAPQTVYDESRPAERLFAPASPQPVPEQSVEERLAKELRFDPDAWIVETEDKAGRHFLDLAKT